MYPLVEIRPATVEDALGVGNDRRGDVFDPGHHRGAPRAQTTERGESVVVVPGGHCAFRPRSFSQLCP